MTPAAAPRANPATRLLSIDALRGLVMLFMLLDHVRETFFLHRQVSDPMEVASTEPGLFISRTLAHLCAPVFVLLTGLSACLFAHKHGTRGAASAFLFKRGLFLVGLELTLVNFAWTGQIPPTLIYLQVIWVIGLSMLALSALLWLPRAALLALSLLLIGGHNLLDDLHFAAGEALHVPWAILHDRGWIEWGDTLRLRTSYPLLPWIGVIGLGYGLGPWFAAPADARQRRQRLLLWGLAALAGFVLLRLLNGYGERPWVSGESGLQTLMSFFNITKYPPSLLFITLTLGVGLLLLRALELRQERRWVVILGVFGGAPMFFYLLHLYVLKGLYLLAVALLGRNHGGYFGLDALWWLWLITLSLAVLLYPPVRAFAQLKARRRDLGWLKYF